MELAIISIVIMFAGAFILKNIVDLLFLPFRLLFKFFLSKFGLAIILIILIFGLVTSNPSDFGPEKLSSEIKQFSNYLIQQYSNLKEKGQKLYKKSLSMAEMINKLEEYQENMNLEKENIPKEKEKQ